MRAVTYGKGRATPSTTGRTTAVIHSRSPADDAEWGATVATAPGSSLISSDAAVVAQSAAAADLLSQTGETAGGSNAASVPTPAASPGAPAIRPGGTSSAAEAATLHYSSRLSLADDGSRATRRATVPLNSTLLRWRLPGSTPCPSPAGGSSATSSPAPSPRGKAATPLSSATVSEVVERDAEEGEEALAGEVGGRTFTTAQPGGTGAAGTNGEGAFSSLAGTKRRRSSSPVSGPSITAAASVAAAVAAAEASALSNDFPAPSRRDAPRLVQSFLDLGQKAVDSVACDRCGMLYAPGLEEREHARHCARVAAAEASIVVWDVGGGAAVVPSAVGAGAGEEDVVAVLFGAPSKRRAAPATLVFRPATYGAAPPTSECAAGGPTPSSDTKSDIGAITFMGSIGPSVVDSAVAAHAIVGSGGDVASPSASLVSDLSSASSSIDTATSTGALTAAGVPSATTVSPVTSSSSSSVPSAPHLSVTSSSSSSVPSAPHLSVSAELPAPHPLVAATPRHPTTTAATAGASGWVIGHGPVAAVLAQHQRDCSSAPLSARIIRIEGAPQPLPTWRREGSRATAAAAVGAVAASAAKLHVEETVGAGVGTHTEGAHADGSGAPASASACVAASTGGAASLLPPRGKGRVPTGGGRGGRSVTLAAKLWAVGAALEAALGEGSQPAAVAAHRQRSADADAGVEAVSEQGRAASASQGRQLCSGGVGADDGIDVGSGGGGGEFGAGGLHAYSSALRSADTSTSRTTLSSSSSSSAPPSFITWVLIADGVVAGVLVGELDVRARPLVQQQQRQQQQERQQPQSRQVNQTAATADVSRTDSSRPALLSSAEGAAESSVRLVDPSSTSSPSSSLSYSSTSLLAPQGTGTAIVEDSCNGRARCLGEDIASTEPLLSSAAAVAATSGATHSHIGAAASSSSDAVGDADVDTAEVVPPPTHLAPSTHHTTACEEINSSSSSSNNILGSSILGTGDTSRDGGGGSWVLDRATPLVPMLIGVTQMWVSPAFRRRGYGAALLDAARATALYAYAVPRSQLAFSQPTGDGRGLALAYLAKGEGGVGGEGGGGLPLMVYV